MNSKCLNLLQRSCLNSSINNVNINLKSVDLFASRIHQLSTLSNRVGTLQQKCTNVQQRCTLVQQSVQKLNLHTSSSQSYFFDAKRRDPKSLPDRFPGR